MKKRVLFIAVCLVLMTFSLAQALPVYQVNSTPGRIGAGGPFQVIGNGLNFQTFCLETGERIALGQRFYGSIDPIVIYGSGGVNNFDVVNANTETLFEYFIANQGSLSNAQKHDIQVAIWAFQGEALPSGETTVGNVYFSNPGQYTGPDRIIKVLNLWGADVGNGPYVGDQNAYSQRKQSVLIPVPEPGMLILLGLGLIGLAGLRRKF